MKEKAPALIYFREVLPGDVRKLRAQSNDSQTGGGARDLRIRPASGFHKYFIRMFPDKTSQEGVTTGDVHWIEPSSNLIKNTKVEYWRPTAARPNEARIAKIHNLDAWTLDEDRYKLARNAGERWFFLLVLDIDDILWARIVEENIIPEMTPIIRNYFISRIRISRRSSRTICGAMDLTNEEEY